MAAGPLHIQYKGVYDKAALIKAVLDWFEKGGYETYFYISKTKTKDFGEEEEYGIKGWVDETDYHRKVVDCYLHLWDANQVEVVHNGEKKMMTKSLLHIRIKGDVERDFYDQFQKTMFGKKLQVFMDKYVQNDKYDTIWDDNHHFVIQGMGDYLKKFLKMNSVGKYF